MDEKIFPAPAVEVEDKSIKNFTDVPDASDINGTMKYWDEYRRKERERILDLGLVRVMDDEGDMISGEAFRTHFTIGEFPTDEALAKKALEDDQKAARQIIADAREQARLLRAQEKPWQRVLRQVRTGISKLSGNSGARSARRTRGTGKTESQ